MSTYELFAPRHAKTCLRAYADTEGPDQPVHLHTLIGPSLSANRIIGYYRMSWMESKGPDTTVEPPYLELAYFELSLTSKWKSGPCFNMKLWQQVTK